MKEMEMAPDAKASNGGSVQPDTVMRRLLGGMSIFTLLMTAPQVLSIWIGHDAAGDEMNHQKGINILTY